MIHIKILSNMPVFVSPLRTSVVTYTGRSEPLVIVPDNSPLSAITTNVHLIGTGGNVSCFLCNIPKQFSRGLYRRKRRCNAPHMLCTWRCNVPHMLCTWRCNVPHMLCTWRCNVPHMLVPEGVMYHTCFVPEGSTYHTRFAPEGVTYHICFVPEGVTYLNALYQTNGSNLRKEINK
jgi:hypothetical protein